MILKKLMALCTAFTMIGGASALPGGLTADFFLNASAEEGDISGTYENLRYLKFSDHVDITGYLDPIEGGITIPGEIDGLPVTVIDEGAFEECDGLTSVVIPEGVTTIEASAFYYCGKLTDVSIPESVTWIGAAAFSYTPWLESRQEEDPMVVVNDILIDGEKCEGIVKVPKGVRLIADNAFVFSDVSEVMIADGVEAIGMAAFGLCLDMTYVNIPDSVISIDDGAFIMCVSLPLVTIPSSVNSIGELAFGFCSSMEKVVILNPYCEIFDAASTFFDDYEDNDENEDPTFFFEGTIIGYEGSTAQAYAEKYGRKFESLGEAPEFFEGGYGDLVYKKYSDHIEITGCRLSAEGEIVIPEKIKGLPVTAIGNTAFAKCSKVTKITIPDRVMSIGENAFSDCYGLTSITIPDSVTSIGDYAFYDCKGLTSVELSPNITYIEKGMFARCESLVSVNIPDGIRIIEQSAFEECESLESVTIPDSVISIGSHAFEGCKGLTSVKLSQKLVEIEDGAFFNCDSLKSVTIPETVKDIGAGAFLSCDSMESIYILNPDCKFYDDINGDFSGTIYGFTASTAQIYAETYKKNFIAIDAEDGLGDVNSDGMVNAVDASEVLAEYARLSSEQEGEFDEAQTAASDVNMDGFTDAVDASNILAYYAYLSVTEGRTMSISAFQAMQ